MNPDRWRQVADLYEAVLEREPAARAAFLAETCGEDADLRREVESLGQEQTPVVVDHEMLSVAAAIFDGIPRLKAGDALGPYRVEALLGAGGMGEVYRARDTKLNRDVALKVLPESFTRDPDRLARFTREAHVLASLNHPNIAAIHGFEDRGDVHALVLELVEGPTLADRIARGPLALPEALPIARQIADALAVAHEHGVIHRDLKPANIKVCDDATVKVLDFGLAKPLQDAQSAPSGSGPTIPAPQSPMVMSPVVTATGMILGTAAYMSPEQAKGRTADKRSDVWTFGCVLYEMLTGKRAFDGEDVSDTLATPRQVSTSGGRIPTWSRRRNELFYLSPDSHLMVVSYTVDGNTFRANPPQKWSEQPINGRPTTRPFDLHPDGDRFVVSGDLANTPKVDKVILVPNFLDEVRRRLSDATR
jgi:eukaryotic-like serine/threonine-protein kinase